MGLPLFVAPVESDLPQKSAEKSTTDPAYARSPIRRTERRRLNEAQAHRQRLLAALRDPNDPTSASRQRDSYETNWYLDLHDELTDLHHRRWHPTSDSDLSRDRRTNEHREDLVLPRIIPDPSGIGWTVERDDAPIPVEPPATGARSSRPVSSTEQTRAPSFERQYRARYQAARAAEAEAARLSRVSSYIRSRPNIFSNRESTPSRTATFGELPLPLPGDFLTGRSRPSTYAAENDYGTAINSPGSRLDRFPSLRERASDRSLRRVARRHARVRYLDGLGDRDRSLSPEGDGVWDTLQSNITPDPQPPSVGSSFASTAASAVASQSQSTAGSSNTSVTSPDEELANENPCDPPAESEDSGDELDVWVVDTEAGGRSTRETSSAARRSYADVAAGPDNNQTQNESSRTEFMENMRRIVRGLASRDDIPDEWWADAGLSRSILREGSN